MSLVGMGWVLGPAGVAAEEDEDEPSSLVGSIAIGFEEGYLEDSLCL
jgi:hypothetical protein